MVMLWLNRSIPNASEVIIHEPFVGGVRTVRLNPNEIGTKLHRYDKKHKAENMEAYLLYSEWHR